MNDNPHDTDSELTQLLNPLREAQPTAEQMHRWRQVCEDNSARFVKHTAKTPRKNLKKSTYATWHLTPVIQWTAAMLVGFVLGALMFNSNPTPPDPAKIVLATNFDPTATITRVYSKSE